MALRHCAEVVIYVVMEERCGTWQQDAPWWCWVDYIGALALALNTVREREHKGPPYSVLARRVLSKLMLVSDPD